MKTALIVPVCKSSWDNADINDFLDPPFKRKR